MYFKTLLTNVYINNQMDRFKTLLIKKNGTKLINSIENQLIHYLKKNIKTNTELIIDINDFIKENKKLNTNNTKKLIDDVLAITFKITTDIGLSLEPISETKIQLSGWNFNIKGFIGNPNYKILNNLSQQSITRNTVYIWINNNKIYNIRFSISCMCK